MQDDYMTLKHYYAVGLFFFFHVYTVTSALLRKHNKKISKTYSQTFSQKDTKELNL